MFATGPDASFAVQRTSANAVDTFDFALAGLFSVEGSSLQAEGLTFATFTSIEGILTINFTNSETTATTALIGEVIDHITYTNSSDAPSSSVTLNYSLNDGSPGGGQGAGGTATAAGSVMVNIMAVNDAHGNVSIIGTAAEDQILTANTSTIADARRACSPTSPDKSFLSSMTTNVRRSYEQGLTAPTAIRLQWRNTHAYQWEQITGIALKTPAIASAPAGQLKTY